MDLKRCSNEVLCENIYDWEGTILVGKNSTINPYIVDKLASSRIKVIPVYPSKKDIKGTDTLYFDDFNKENILALKEIMNGLAIGEELETKKLQLISDGLYEEVNNNNEIVKQLIDFKCSRQYTYNHSINVAIYSLLMGKWIGLDEDELNKVVKAGLLHDIGKYKIPLEILNKKGKLTREEFKIVKTHTIIGYEMSESIFSIDDDIRKAILSHHEREDGSGYPYELKGDEINIIAKILAIADVYDALTSERVYKDKSTPFEAIEEFHKMGLCLFDTQILEVFFKNIINYYVDAKVKTNYGEIGEIVYIPPHDITKPVIKLENSYVDLSKNNNIKIVEMIS